jgi:hypothetical protein
MKTLYILVLTIALSGCAGTGSGLNDFPSFANTSSGTTGFGTAGF